MKLEIVLDKSYLRGSPAASIRRLCSDYRVIMPGALFYELLACSASDRARCYAKFPAVLNPVELVENVGVLLRYEARHRKPAASLYDRRAKILFEFNPKLAAGTFEFTQEQQEGIAKWRQEVAIEADIHAATCAVTHKWFPKILGASGRANPSVIAEVRQAVATDPKLVRLLYNSIRRRSMPRQSAIDSRWACFRWMQVHLLAALRHMETHGLDAAPRDRRQLEHDVLDIQYQIMGILAGRIATRDKNVIRVVSELAPKTMILLG